MRLRLGSRARGGLAAALLAAVSMVAAAPVGAATEPSGRLVAGSEETVLRLHDLPPGYQVSGDVGCGALIPFGEEGDPEGRLETRFVRWVGENRPEGCFYEYERVFEVPGLGPAPPLVEAEPLNTPSEEAAVEGLELYNELLDRGRYGKGREMVTISPTGVEARLVRSREVLVDGREHQLGSFLVWRHGKLIALLTAAGLDPRRNDEAAIHFARIQQQRLEAPSPYTEAERDDSEVELDDPRLKFPVYWVGNPFEFGGAPPASLESAFAVSEGPALKFNLAYSPVKHNGFELRGWTRRSWKRFLRSGLAWGVDRPRPCTRTTEVKLERGTAVIYGVYRGTRRRSCPRRDPDRHYAIARIGRMVIGVNLGFCRPCAPGAAPGPYGSLRGLKAIVRALHLRPKPVY
jgi:hypothetical protein